MTKSLPALFLVVLMSSCRTSQIISSENQLEVSQFIKQDSLNEIKIEPVKSLKLASNLIDDKILLSKKVIINQTFRDSQKSYFNKNSKTNQISANKDKPKKINKLAVASFATGLLSVAFAFIGALSVLSLIGLILSVVLALISIIQIYRSKGEQGGIGISILSLAMALISVVIILIASFSFVMGP